jgi:hypothetical protein
MLIYGVNLPPGYGKDIDIYVIQPINIRISGPEIVTENILESGNILEVQSIRKSINHILGYPTIDSVVTITPYEKEVDVPVVIDLKYLQSTDYMKRLEYTKDDM